jgi:hypothetical protein
MSDSVVVINSPGTPSNVIVSGTTTGPQGPVGPPGVVISTTAPSTSVVWADPNDTTYTTLVDGGSA